MFSQRLPEYQVAHERAVYKAIAIVADTKKVVKLMDIDDLAELRGMQKPSLEIEDLMAAIIMLCEFLCFCCVVSRFGSLIDIPPALLSKLSDIFICLLLFSSCCITWGAR